MKVYDRALFMRCQHGLERMQSDCSTAGGPAYREWPLPPPSITEVKMRRLVTLVMCVGAVVFSLVSAMPVAAEGLFPASVASGDPKPDSVILWTRVVDPALPDALLAEVATDMAFADVVFSQQVTVSADNDWCVKVRATGLEPYTTYYYRFVYGSGGTMETSRVGRTKTAPTPDTPCPLPTMACTTR